MIAHEDKVQTLKNIADILDEYINRQNVDEAIEEVECSGKFRHRVYFDMNVGSSYTMCLKIDGDGGEGFIPSLSGGSFNAFDTVDVAARIEMLNAAKAAMTKAEELHAARNG